MARASQNRGGKIQRMLSWEEKKRVTGQMARTEVISESDCLFLVGNITTGEDMEDDINKGSKEEKRE